MERLIDAGKILDNLSGMLKSMDDYDAVRKVINDMPTVYDVDKVIERLEIEKNPIYREDGSLMAERAAIGIDKAIEIVKGGGVNGN